MSPRKLLVRLGLIATVLAAVLAVPDWLTTEKIVYGNDFFQYWSAGRFVLEGGSPYDHQAFFEFQKSVGWENSIPFITWNPPWAIGLFLPFALLRYAPAVMLWLFVQGALIVGSAILLWKRYSGSREGERLVVFMAVLFTPALLSIIFGQISGWLLVGVTLAVLGVEEDRAGFVGAGVVLMSVKPHFTFLLMLALLWWGLRRRPLAFIAGSSACLLLLLAVPLTQRPTLIVEYLNTVLHSQPREYVSDTLGAGLRLLLGWNHFWVQFLPLSVGIGWLCREAVLHRGSITLEGDRIPLLALVSALVAPYGWLFDNVVAIPALVLVWSDLSRHGSRSTRSRFLGGFAGFCLLLLGLHVWLWDPMQWVHGWVPACLLAVFLHYRRPEAGHVAEAGPP